MQKKPLYVAILAAAVLVAPYSSNVLGKQTSPVPEDKKANREYRKTIDGVGALTEEMIEGCIRLNMEVDASYAEIGKAKKRFDDLNSELTELAEYLKTAKEEVYQGGSEVRKAYDEKVKNYNARVPELDQQLDKYKKMVEEYHSKSAKFDKECNGQPYYQDDYAAMVKKMGRGM